MDQFKEILKEYPEIYVVCDRNVEQYIPQLGLQDCPRMAIDATEENKTIETAVELCRWLLSSGADRDALLLAVGGGVTTDIAGFAASIYKRGIKYANVPTTLVGQVDAGLGGKTGVNLDGYKNILGCFREPEFVYVLPETLESLPEREFRSGAAELLKTFIIDNEYDCYETAVKILREPLNLEELAPLISCASEIKQEIVEKDPYDQGERRVLNLGHTWAHAIEWYEQTHPVKSPLLHGEAVSIGIVQAARKSVKLGLAKPELVEKLRKDLHACGLPVELPYSESELEQAIAKDKKAQGGRINYVLPVEIGKVVIRRI